MYVGLCYIFACYFVRTAPAADTFPPAHSPTLDVISNDYKIVRFVPF